MLLILFFKGQLLFPSEEATGTSKPFYAVVFLHMCACTNDVKHSGGRDLESANRAPVDLTSHLQVLHHMIAQEQQQLALWWSWFFFFFLILHLIMSRLRASCDIFLPVAFNPHPSAKCVFLDCRTYSEPTLDFFLTIFPEMYFSFLIFGVISCQEQIATV